MVRLFPGPALVNATFFWHTCISQPRGRFPGSPLAYPFTCTFRMTETKHFPNLRVRATRILVCLRYFGRIRFSTALD